VTQENAYRLDPCLVQSRSLTVLSFNWNPSAEQRDIVSRQIRINKQWTDKQQPDWRWTDSWTADLKTHCLCCRFFNHGGRKNYMAL